MNVRISALEYVQGVRSGAISAEEFLAATMERIRDTDDALHSFLQLSGSAVQQAREIDKKIRRGQDAGICPGLAVAVKDNICARNFRTTCGSMMLRDYVSPYDASVVSRLSSEGAIIVGKTNMDEFAMGLTGEFSAFGPTRNPWDAERVPGGSSSGSAAAVSSCQCTAALGSDTGGSVRNPASFCGIVGLKPTYGLVSRYGLVSYANSIEQIGPMARSAKDCALLLSIISGHDINDDTTMQSGAPQDYLKGIDGGVEGKRIGVVQEMTGPGVSDDVLSAASEAIGRLESMGASCGDVSIEMVKYSVAAYYTITATEAGSNLARFDGIRYGHDAPPEGAEFNSYVTAAREMLGPEVKRRMIMGGFIPSAGHAGKYLLKALNAKTELAREIRNAFAEYDLLVSPTVPVLPFRLGEKIDDPIALFLIDINTVAANLTGVPAISVPAAVRNGLPVGLQIMAKPFAEKELFAAAHALEQKTNIPEAPA